VRVVLGPARSRGRHRRRSHLHRRLGAAERAPLVAVATTLQAFAYVFSGSAKFCNASGPLRVPTEGAGWLETTLPAVDADQRSLCLDRATKSPCRLGRRRPFPAGVGPSAPGTGGLVWPHRHEHAGGVYAGRSANCRRGPSWGRDEWCGLENVEGDFSGLLRGHLARSCNFNARFRLFFGDARQMRRSPFAWAGGPRDHEPTPIRRHIMRQIQAVAQMLARNRRPAAQGQHEEAREGLARSI